MKIFKIFVLTCLIFSAGLVYGVISCNNSECAFENQCDAETSEQLDVRSSGNLKTSIVLGASAYLKSQSYFNRFLSQYELYDLYRQEPQKMNLELTEAIEEMEKAYSFYFELYYIALYTEYDYAIIERLKDFDYYGFMKEFKLRSEIVMEVKKFLASSNVRGAYYQMLSRTDNILNNLYALRYSLNKGSLPDVWQVWHLNQMYSDTLLYGQYVAMIFKSIT